MAQSELNLTLGEKLLILRRRKGWSRAQLAQKLHVKTRRVRSWEEGKRKPNQSATDKAEQFITRHIKKTPQANRNKELR